MVVNLSLCSRRQVIRLCSTRFGLKRHESIASTAISGAESLLVGMRSLDIMPWSAVICSTAVVARLGLLLPIAIKSEIYRTRLELLSPTLREWTDALRFKVYATCRREGKTQEEADKVLKIKVKKKRKEILAKEGLQRWKIIAVGLSSLPVWILMSLANSDHFVGVRQVCLNAYQGSPTTALLVTEGLPWCTDLSQTDSTLVIPILLVLSNLANVQASTHHIQLHRLTLTFSDTVLKKPQLPPGANSTMNEEPRFPVMLTSIALLMLPIYAALPSGLLLYWLTSSVSTVLQSFSFRLPAVRRKLRIPPSPSETSSPLYVVTQNARQDWHTFWNEVYEKNFRKK
eukprot:gene10431-2562_t